MYTLRDKGMIAGFRLEQPIGGHAALTHCGEALFSAGHRTGLHQHGAHEFVYLSRGEAHWKVAGQTHRQTSGDLFVTFPDEPHTTAPRPHPQYHLLFLGLRLSRSGAAGRRLDETLARHRLRLIPHAQDAEPVLRGLIQQAVRRQSLRVRVIHAYIRTFLALVEQRVRLLRAGPGSRTAIYSYCVEKTLRLMRDNLNTRLPLKDMAAMAGLGVSQLSRLFQKEVGLPPAACHLQMRLEAAKDALKQREFSVTLVAHKFGFSSSQHFSTAFRQVYGMTPRAWQDAQAR